MTPLDVGCVLITSCCPTQCTDSLASLTLSPAFVLQVVPWRRPRRTRMPSCGLWTWITSWSSLVGCQVTAGTTSTSSCGRHVACADCWAGSVFTPSALCRRVVSRPAIDSHELQGESCNMQYMMGVAEAGLEASVCRFCSDSDHDFHNYAPVTWVLSISAAASVHYAACLLAQQELTPKSGFARRACWQHSDRRRMHVWLGPDAACCVFGAHVPCRPAS